MVNNEITTGKYAFIDGKKCVLCGSCQEKCPEYAITYDSENDSFIVLKERCIGCGICIKCCPYNIPELKYR